MPTFAPLTTLALILGSAILIRHDRPDEAHLELGERYGDAVAHVEERAEGTLVARRWVLTAAHVIEASGPFDAPYVVLGGERYAVEKVVLHPDWEGSFADLTTAHDLALLKLDRPVPGVEPVPLYRLRVAGAGCDGAGRDGGRRGQRRTGLPQAGQARIMRLRGLAGALTSPSPVGRFGTEIAWARDAPVR